VEGTQLAQDEITRNFTILPPGQTQAGTGVLAQQQTAEDKRILGCALINA